MSAPRILLAGATGAVGRALLPLLRDGGYRIRTLSRSAERARPLSALADEVIVSDATRPDALSGIAAEMDIVVSCVGASVGLGLGDRRSFAAVDTVANTNLLSAARASGVRRFVYVAAHVEPGYAGTHYIRAHEGFVEALRASGLSSTVVRPTGLFTSFRDLLPIAARGRMVIIGDGRSRTNPVHPSDVARICLDVLDGGPADSEVGGPDVLTRTDIARAAFAAVGEAPRLVHVAPWVFRAVSRALRIFHPRLGELLELASQVSVVDSVAPKLGKRHLEEYFRQEWAAFGRSPRTARLGAAPGA